MKVRSRKYKVTSESPSYWPSFVDIMTTISLVFFFIMIVSSGISKMFVDNIAEKREDLYTVIQQKLDDNNVDKNVIQFADGKMNINTEAFFETGKWDLSNDGIALSQTLGNIFKDLLSDDFIYKEINYIEVVGHTDYIGDTIANRRLSTERAMSFLNSMVPINSELENNFGHKFKASGMSEFETNPTIEERNRTEYTDDPSNQRKIEIKMIFSNSDLEKAIEARSKKNE